MSSNYHESFNARNLSFEQIAETFIENTQFWELTKNNHSLLMGPRGSGKTTLLKMLTIEALFSWRGGKMAENLRTDPPFFAIYIPTDTQFKEQLNALNRSIDPATARACEQAIMNINICTSLLDTFIALTKTYMSLEDRQSVLLETQVCSEIISAWKLPKRTLPLFTGVQRALRERLLNISVLVNRLTLNFANNSGQILEDYFFEDFQSLISIGISIFQDTYSLYPELKAKNWAYCFDELELAPEWWQSKLLSLIRSTDQKILFKLTTSPLISFYKNIENSLVPDASQNDDYDIIRTWESESWNQFAQQLLIKKFQKKLSAGANFNPLVVFGTSSLDRTIRRMFKDRYKFLPKSFNYELNSPALALFRELSSIDPAFSRFMEKKGLAPFNSITENKEQNDSIIRKFKPLALYRYQFLKINNESVLVKRSRKRVSLHYGLPHIYELCDGNPRVLSWIIEDLMKITPNSRGEIDIEAQSTVLTEFSTKYLKILSTHPDAHIPIGKNSYDSLAAILSKIGNFFHYNITNTKFVTEPYGYFRVDKQVSDNVLKLMELALAQGAIIYLKPEDAITKEGILNKEFRLSYLLCPHFKIPKRQYNVEKLSTILNQKVLLNQITIFDL